jgi:hypothetical protein
MKLTTHFHPVQKLRMRDGIGIPPYAHTRCFCIIFLGLAHGYECNMLELFSGTVKIWRVHTLYFN